MHSALSPFAPARKLTLLLVGGTMFAGFVTAAMVALPLPVASTNDIHAAAPRFAIQKTAKKSVTVPVHKAPDSLLAVTNQKDILPRQRLLADQVLRSLPHYCRDNLKNFYVNYDKNAANRGLGGESTIIIIGNVPDSEFRALLIHECGHVVDLGGLRGSVSSGKTNFYDGSAPIFGNDPSVAFYSIRWTTPVLNTPGTKDEDFVSGYAASDPFEDFAETFAFYALQQEAFQRIAAGNPILQAKYNFMQQVVFTGTKSIAKGRHVPGKKVPWDTTKLPYTWHAKR